MGEIYVTGHRNPDTDSIAASIAYANLRNAIGDREYKAVRIGSINDETRHILDLLGLDPPPFVKDMRTQVSDLDFDQPPELNASVPINLAWNTMRNNEVASLPILNDDGTLYGVISAGDIASFDMQTVYSSQVDELPLFNLLSVIEGRVVNELHNTVNSVSGNVVVALPSAFESGRCKDGILICGNQPDAVERAIGHGAGCIILCQAEVKPEWASLETPCIISSPLDGRIVSRVIYQAQPIRTICHTENIVCFHLSDYLDDVREVLLESRFRAYPVLDENGGLQSEKCPVLYALSIIGQKWKLPILWYLYQGEIIRYNELKRKMPDITNGMLSKSLRELEENGLINRVQYPEIPPKVEYSLTDRGKALIPALNAIYDWGSEQMKYKQEKN